MPFVKGKGNGKGGNKGKGKGEFFEGNCDFCGSYGHRARDCRKKDRYREDLRKGKGGGKAGGQETYGGKNSYKGDKGGGYKGYGKGNENGYNAYKGKGKGTYLNVWDTGYNGPSQGGGAWTMSLTKQKTEIEKPPGLLMSNAWEAIKEDEDQEDVDDAQVGSVENMVSAAFLNYSKDFPKTRMGNYSKRSVKENHMGPRRDMRKEGTPLKVLTKQAKEVSKELNLNLVDYKTVHVGWMKARGVMDSGASEGVAPPSMCPH